MVELIHAFGELQPFAQCMVVVVIVAISGSIAQVVYTLVNRD